MKILLASLGPNEPLCTQIWRRQWHPTPVLLPRKPHGWTSLLPHDVCPEWNASPAPGTGSVHAQSRYQCLLSHVITDGTVT